ncbi:MAG: DUF421 domain-containing protein [Candidatus Limnocylindrales bacterium]
MFQLTVSPLELVLRTLIVYGIFFVLLRLSGKRELGQFTIFDLALVLLAANALQPAMTGPDSTVTGGLIVLITIFALSGAIAFSRSRVPWVRHLVEFEPTTIGRDGTWLPAVVEEEELDQSDLGAALREHGLEDVRQVKLATLEEDGSISIVAYDGTGNATARRRRRTRRGR